MRIGYEACSVRPFRSGVGHYAAALLESLAGEFPAHEFLVFSHLSRSSRPAFSSPNLIAAQGQTFPIKEIWLQLILPRIMEYHRPDLCHFTNAIAPLRLRFPYVLTVHDLSLIRHPEWHPWTRRLWMRRLLRPSVLGARLVLCDSEATRADLANWLPAAQGRLHLVPLGVRNSFLHECTEEHKQRVLAQFDLRRPFLLYVGNIEPRKNLKLLLAAFDQMGLADVDLVLVGRRAWLWRDVMDSMAKLRAAAQVRVPGYVAEKDLAALFQSALAFVYPSRMEGFGLPVLEAMAAGLPVVVAQVEPLISLAGDAGISAGPDDVMAWSSALREVCCDADLRRRLGQRGRERARAFTWEEAARRTMGCYEIALRKADMAAG